MGKITKSCFIVILVAIHLKKAIISTLKFNSPFEKRGITLYNENKQAKEEKKSRMHNLRTKGQPRIRVKLSFMTKGYTD